MLATENWDFRNRKFRLQAYWAVTRTSGAGNMPWALGDGPRLRPFSVLSLNSEPVTKKKKNCWKASLTFWKLQSKISFGKDPLSFVGSPLGFPGRIYVWMPWPASPAACVSVLHWVALRETQEQCSCSSCWSNQKISRTKQRRSKWGSCCTVKVPQR